MKLPILSVGRRVRFRHVLNALDAYTREPRAVLDVGCGDGSLAVSLGRRFPRAHVVGIDPNAALPRGRLPKNVTIRRAAIGDSLDDEFDAILCTDVLEHIVDDAGAFDWLASHLQPEGVLLVHVPATPQKHHIRFVADAMREEVATGRGPHLREGYSRESLHKLAEGTGLRIVSLTSTFHALPTQLAADLDTLSFLLRLRPLKAVLLPFLLAGGAFERAASDVRQGNGLLLVASRRVG
jgi:2-polyprenyl-3-methyl-5-hydroxy-6-metoxy-1,4-benzoquinol methylase